MRLLIAGGFGYLGGRFAAHMSRSSTHKVVLGTRQSLSPPNWLPQSEVAKICWDSPDALREICANVDAIVHMAGMNAQESHADPVGALEFNGVATARLLQAAVQQRVKRFIYISSAHVYGNNLSGVITEETCPRSLHPYATSHRAGEDVVRAAQQNAEIEGVVVRLSNSFGAPVHKDVNTWMLLVNDLCRQAATSRRLELQSSGAQRRDFIPLTDACRAIEHLLEISADRLGAGLFNVTSGRSPTVLEVAGLVADRFYALTNSRPEIVRPAAKDNELTVQ
ncbi:MAG TPA: SDR family oxidoreductase, partial [Pyrinomonadaceae bacterium]|nr:SDR family oxidoreductase [Pyrinomonadaceae bacterium]